ncbi:hypothetical protein C8R44DRAFT_731538 [Mycena epipterygia]|nr:hypothetical protein C8R44DRAFT_731538 [Mycena epipterygia]
MHRVTPAMTTLELAQVVKPECFDLPTRDVTANTSAYPLNVHPSDPSLLMNPEARELLSFRTIIHLSSAADLRQVLGLGNSGSVERASLADVSYRDHHPFCETVSVCSTHADEDRIQRGDAAFLRENYQHAPALQIMARCLYERQWWDELGYNSFRGRVRFKYDGCRNFCKNYLLTITPARSGREREKKTGWVQINYDTLPSFRSLFRLPRQPRSIPDN